MLAHLNGTWLKAEARNFTNDAGEVINYYRASILDEDMTPFELGISEECYDFASREVPALTPCEFIVQIRRNASGLRIRIENMVVL